MRKKRRILWFRFFLFVVLIGIGGGLLYRYYEVMQRKKGAVMVQEIPPVPVEVREARRTSQDIIGEFRGVLKPIRETTVSARVGGMIDKVFFMEGDHVKKDETIVVIDDEILSISLDEAKARYQKAVILYEDAQRDLKRKKELSKEKIISEEDYIKAEVNAQIAFNEMKTLEAEMERRSKDVEYATVTAPFDGIISRINVDEGETVFQATTLFSILDVSRLKIHFYVTDIEIPAFRVGLPLTFTVDAYPDENFMSKVVSIDPGSDEDYLNFRITSLYDNDDPETLLLPGMVVRIQARLGRIEDQFFMPADVVFLSEEGSFLFVIDDSTAHKVFVAVDRQIGNEIAVTSGLQEGDRVVVTGHSSLQNGTKVRLVGSAESTQETAP